MPFRPRAISLLAAFTLLIAACQPAAPPPQAASRAAPEAKPPSAKAAPTRVTIAVTETVEKQNPYADSVSLLYGIWCHVLGCLVSYDWEKGDYAPALAESWKVENPTTWVFNLRKNVTWHDGSPFTAADVIHSFDRIKNDKDSRQKQNIAPVASVEQVDDYTVKVITKSPTASLLSYFADLLIITNKARFDQYGDKVWEQKPLGTGPYMFKELVPDQYMTIVKNPNWWGGPVEGPDEVVFRVMRETEVRVTALLNNEVQIAQFIPPHMADRVTASPNHKIVPADSVEIMFLAMQPKPPFDNKLVRQAVTHAIDRDAIIQNILLGYAQRLDGPVGAGQYAYDLEMSQQLHRPYDPQKAKQLLAQAGFPNGVDVELSTPVGRYTLDKQISEAMAQMLTQVGIRTKLLTPEWSTLWANVQDGKVPFYYMGRGSVIDPGLPLSQYFETGVSPRIGYSNSMLDELFKQERAAFDPDQRKQKLHETFEFLVDEAPAHFLWRHKLLWGMAKHVEYTPRPDARIFANEIRVK